MWSEFLKIRKAQRLVVYCGIIENGDKNISYQVAHQATGAGRPSGRGGGRGKCSSANGDLPKVAKYLAGAVKYAQGLCVSWRRGTSRNETRAPNVGALPDTCIMHVNIQGLRSHVDELCAVVRLSATPPDIVRVNETFLDDGVEQIELEGFDVVGRRDRSYSGDDRSRGGVIVFARAEIANHVTLSMISEVAERLWIQLHTNNGPYLSGP